MPESSNIFNFLREYGTLLLALYGIIQVWFISLWKNVLRTGKLSIYETGRLEVGYSNFGPTIALNGTLCTQRKNLFVSNISLFLTKNRDQSTHTLEWTAFRSSQLRIVPTDPISLELPSGFIVRIDQPHRYHIFFSDKQTRSELEPVLIDVRKEWQEYLNSKKQHIYDIVMNAKIEEKIVIQSIFEKEFYLSNEKAKKAWDLLNRKNYLENGSYRLKMIVKTSNPSKSFTAEWLFDLSEDEFQILRLNSVSTLRELCLGEVNYFFAFPEYKQALPNNSLHMDGSQARRQ